MFNTPLAGAQTATTRIVIYAGCVSSIFLAGFLFCFHSRLQAVIPAGRAKSGPGAQVQPRLMASYGRLPLSFEANQGQAGAGVKFLARGPGYGLFLTSDEAALELQKTSVVRRPLSEARTTAFGARSASNSKTHKGFGTYAPPMDGYSTLQRTTDNGPRTRSFIHNPKSKIENQVVRVRLVGAQSNAEVIGRDVLPGKVNYFIGNDPKKWRTNVPTYAKVRYHDVYPGVDLEYYGNQGGHLEYDFIVAPGTDPGAITLQVGAVREPPLRIDRNGDLVIAAKAGEVRLHKPVIYQSGSADEQRTTDKGPQTAANPKSKIENPKSVGGRFVLDAQNHIRFAIGPYDRSKPLVIDPELVYSTYLGGDTDQANGIAVDSSGDAYVTGTTFSTKFPIVNAFQSVNKAANGTAFVSKFNPSGSALIYSTYLGGSSSDQGKAIAIDSSGNAYVTGSTCSSDFPTALPLQASLLGPCDGFVTKLNTSGTSLVYSTFLGGIGVPANGSAPALTDKGTGIAVDSAGSAYVTGGTWSTDFPTVNPIQSYGGGGDAFLTKFNASGTALIYSTYLGGSGFDQGSGIAVDSSGNAYVIGSTLSPDFPLVNPIDSSPSEENGTAFVAKLNSAGSALVYSTYLGGSISEEGEGIAVDSSGNAYLTGATWSSNFPTVNPLQATNHALSSEASNAFVSKLNAAGSALVYSTYLGGSGVLYNPLYGEFGDYGLTIAIDPTGVACLGGETASTDFPTLNAIQATDNNTAPPPSFTGFVACLNGAGSALAYSTYLGGSGEAQANGVAVDASGNAYVAGISGGSGFPTASPFQGSVGGAFVAAISPPPALTISASTLSFGTVVGGTTSPPQTVMATPLSTASVSLTSITTSGDFALVTTATSCPYGGGTVAAGATCSINVTFSPTATGNRTGTVTITYTGSGSPETVALSGTGIAPAANISPTSLSFSTQDVGSLSPPQVVTLTNTGPLVLPVSAVATSSGWKETNNCVSSIAANSSCTISVSFEPAVFGPQTGTLTITDAATNSPQTVALSGTALAPVVSLSTTSLNFPGQTVSTQSAAQTITLTNTGNGALTPLTISASGDFAETNTCAESVAPNASCTISVTFTPTTAGPRGGAVTLTDNASNSPQTVTLSGTGIGPVASLSTTSLTFPAQTVSTKSAPLTIALTNAGNGVLTPLKFARTGDFAQTNTCGGSVAAGASCTISVTFSPSDAGSLSGMLTLTDNAANSPQTIPLSGTGMDFAFTNATPSQTVNAGQTANYTFGVASEYGFSQAVNLACTGAPTLSTCTLSPTQVTPISEPPTIPLVTMAVTTTAPSTSRLAPPPGRFRPPGLTGWGRVVWLLGLLGLTSVVVLATARKRRAAYLLAACLLLAMLWSACGGGSSTTPPKTIPGTPAGTYTIDVTATDATVSTLTHTFQFTLTVN